MRAFANGAFTLVGYSPPRCSAAVLSRATSGIWMVCHEHISEVGDVELYERRGVGGLLDAGGHVLAAAREFA